MLTRNPFATPAQAPASPASVQAAEDVLKGKQLLKGRTRPKVDTLIVQVNDAKKNHTAAKQALGERESNGDDVTSSIHAVQQARDRLDALEAALIVAIQKDEAADIDLQEAQRQVKIEKEVAVVAHARHVCRKVDQLIIEFERLLVDEANPALNGAREVLVNSGIREGELNFLTELPLVLKQHVALAMCSTLREGFTPSTMVKYKHVSECIPDDDFIRSRARPGPSTAKPIPGWQ